MLVKTYCAAVNGLDVTTVTVEVSLSRGVLYHLTGPGGKRNINIKGVEE
jgi:magnesium chelatase family protein